MKTQTKYEEIFLAELRTLPMPVLPQALKMLRLLKEGVMSVARPKSDVEKGSTGLCGAWQDERTADEIIADITLHRSGFGGRRVDL
jgi:hypothetical protein